MSIIPPLNFATARVICIGDVMLDHFIYGKVERISPEAPIPVLNQDHKFSVLGGAGNVMRNLLSLGGEVIFISVIGNDEVGRRLREEINQITIIEKGDDKVNDANFIPIKAELIIEDNRKTIEKTRFIAQGQQLLRVDSEKVVQCQADTEQTILELIKKHLPDSNALILSDYNKGLLSKNLTRNIIKLVRQQTTNYPIIVDPKGKNYDHYRGATLITPNLKELIEVTGRIPPNQGEVVELANHLRQELSIESVLVTQGDQGMTLVEKQNPPVAFPAQAREVYDVSGAGDTVVATLSLALASGYSLTDSCFIANQAAGVVVGKVGTANLNRLELEHSLNRESTTYNFQKIVDINQALDLLKNWRHRGLKVGFMNGCFDLLHLGHLHSLRQAAKLCDKLIIGLNSDSSVRGLKGVERPIQDQNTRANVLAALTMVDGITIFEEKTPINLIQQLQPDILFKGADYTLDQVVGADIVKAYGGKVILLDLFQGHSTTNTVAKIKELNKK